MSFNFEDKPFSESHLDSPEYRKRLMRKLNTLIAVLEVACAKVRRTLAGPDPDVERLNRIHKNLKDTLQVCMRAKKALARCEKLPEDFPTNLQQIAKLHNLDAGSKEKASRGGKLNAKNAATRSPEELDRIHKLGPIQAKDVHGIDLDGLCRQLLGGK